MRRWDSYVPTKSLADAEEHLQGLNPRRGQTSIVSLSALVHSFLASHANECHYLSSNINVLLNSNAKRR